MINTRLREMARLISFLQAQDFLSLEKEIKTPRRCPRNIQDDKTEKLRLAKILRDAYYFLEGPFTIPATGSCYPTHSCC